MSEEGVPTPEKKSHTTRNALIIVLVIVVILALFFGLFFGLRGCDNDNPNDTPDPDDVNPDPEIVEPGPEEEPEHTHEYGNWQYDDTYHWKECECGDVIDKAEHTLGDPALGDDGYYQTCSVCGYTTAPEEAVPTYWKVETTSELIIETTNSESGDPQGTLDLDNYVSITIYDQYGGELSGEGLDSYTVAVVSGDISVNNHIVTSTQYEAGAASVTLTSSVIENATADLTITLTQKTYNVTTITIDGSNAATHTIEWGGSYTPTIEVSPSYVTNSSYSVTSSITNSSTGTYFTYEGGTFTHNKTHSGSEKFTVSALDGSGVSASITITAEPEILEPQSAAFDGLSYTYEINTVVDNLDSYLKVNFDEEEHDEGDFVDDTCTVEYTSSNTNVVTIDNSAKTATCVGTGTATITATITPDHDTDHPITTENGAFITVKLTATELTINQTSATLDVGDTLDLNVTFGPSDYTVAPDVSWSITESSSDGVVSLSTDTGTSITVTAVNAGTATVTASADGCNSVSCEITVETMVASISFATDSWDTINTICGKGLASTYYNIGDTKTIMIDDEEHDIRIIDFDHDDLTNTDDNGYGDSNYNGGSNKAGITCEMENCLSTPHTMNGSSTNSGGWYSCGMRSYLESDILPTLDSDLQSVIKKVDKKSTKGGGSTSLGTTSSDSLFLLARVEVDATTDSGYVNEGTIYTYYQQHNTDGDRIKTINDGTTKFWWLRSPYTGSSTNFHRISSSGGTSGTYTASSSSPVISFAFCI